jgi:hypothetical protein
MIPESFSENYCGLQEKKLNKSMKVDFYFNRDGTEKTDKKDVVNRVDVYINKNYVYEEESLMKHPEYMSLLKLTQQIESSTKDSHDLVSFWMIKTNELCAKHLKENKKGVFRKTQHNTLVHSNKAYCDISSEYVLYQHNDNNDYAHVTSPIRRLVDILNQIIMYENISGKMLSENANNFLLKWLSMISFINASMKSIRQLQFDCNLLNYFHKKENISHRTYQCIIIDKKIYDSSFFSYTIFVPEIKLFSKVSKTFYDVEIDTLQKVIFFLFYNQSELFKRIRVEIKK